MNYINSIVLGVVEGATEFLPISSTFHLIWVSKMLGIAATDFQKAFEVIIQGGAILAVVVLYWKTITTNSSLIKKVCVSFIPTAAVAFTLYNSIKDIFFESVVLQLLVFVFIGVVFILYEKFSKRRLGSNLSGLSYKDAVVIGLIQALAIIPGVSRAGAVILGLMFLGVKRDEAAAYSFLLAVPTLFAASGLDFVKILPDLILYKNSMGVLLAGFISSFISALLVAKWLIGYLKKHSLSSFGWYRVILGIILTVFN